MAKAQPRFECQDCGAVTSRWAGRCESCGAWNSIVEAPSSDAAPRGLGKSKGRPVELVELTGTADDGHHIPTGIAEFDRVCGGGLVPGSALLVGGDPGIGKSTLLLQATAGLARQGVPCVYITGEEAVGQIRLRAQRLGIDAAPLRLAAATNVRDIVATLDAADAPKVVVIDSIQTMFVDVLDSAPGTVAQVRTSAQELIRLGKRRGTTLVLVGHVTKDGQIAGPRVLEHMVDTVLYFEGERGHQFRILRTVKNRYGPTDEIGVFDMTDRGLREVANPSALFLGEHSEPVSGAVVFAGVEGTRPMLVEIQALVAPSGLATPRRAAVGGDAARLAMILAVLDARCGFSLAGRDVFLNVAGGLRVHEPAADLAVAAALVSSLTGVPVPAETVVFGEIGLSGEIRPVSQTEPRLKEAAKLGFERAWLPRAKSGAGHTAGREFSQLPDLVAMFTEQAERSPAPVRLRKAE